MTDIQAAIGREQLTRLPAIVARRRELAARYHERAARTSRGVIVPAEPACVRTNWQSYAIRVERGTLGAPSCSAMLDERISTRRGAHERAP